MAAGMLSWLPENYWACGMPFLAFLIDFMIRKMTLARVYRMSMEILEHADATTIKDATRNVWTNAAITAALILTVSVAMLQIEPIEMVREDGEDHFTLGVRPCLRQFYVATCLVSTLKCLTATIRCVVDLTFCEPLSPQDAVKFLIANPGTFGRVFALVAESLLWLLMGMCTWVAGTYGLPNAVLTMILSVQFGYMLDQMLVDRSRFDPSGTTDKSIEWKWTLQPEESWPEFVSTRFPGDARHRMVKLMKSTQNAPNATVAADGERTPLLSQ